MAERETLLVRALVFEPFVGDSFELGHQYCVERRLEQFERELFLDRSVDRLAQVFPALAGQREFGEAHGGELAELE